MAAVRVTRASRSLLPAAAILAVVSAALTAPSSSRVGLLSDLPDEALAKIAKAPAAATPAALLDAVIAATGPYSFVGGGVQVVTDTRWFKANSVEGHGAPLIEVRRWPGDTVLAFYDLPPAGSFGDTLPAGMTAGARREANGPWSCRDAAVEGPRFDVAAVWCERGVGETRRLGALGVPGDAGLGEAAIPDLRDSLLAVIGSLSVDNPAAHPTARPLLPQLGDSPRAADETKSGWGSFQGEDYSLGLPPGIRAIRLDAGVPAPRGMPYGSAWLRGRFVDRDGTSVIVGDGKRAGYLARIVDPGEAWRAGVAPPLGARTAERLDEARLDETVPEWTGASRAVVSHWKETGFAGDWLVFRLHFPGKGIEIGLPVVSGWRSLALFWIPVTYRSDGKPPAPPPIDPAAALGVRFDQLKPGDAKRNGLIEGTLFIADLRVAVPRGFWPIANLGSRDGLPVTFIGPDGNPVGRLEVVPAGSAPRTEDGWVVVEKPASQHAAAIWTRADGATVLLAKDGHGFALLPDADIPAQREAWRLMRERAEFVKAARRR
jgi:hypothetical protein